MSGERAGVRAANNGDGLRGGGGGHGDSFEEKRVSTRNDTKKQTVSKGKLVNGAERPGSVRRHDRMR